MQERISYDIPYLKYLRSPSDSIKLKSIRDYIGRMGPLGQPEEFQMTDNGGKNEVSTYNIPIKCWSVMNVVNEIVLISGWPWRQRG